MGGGGEESILLYCIRLELTMTQKICCYSSTIYLFPSQQQTRHPNHTKSNSINRKFFDGISLSVLPSISARVSLSLSLPCVCVLFNESVLIGGWLGELCVGKSAPKSNRVKRTKYIWWKSWKTDQFPFISYFRKWGFPERIIFYFPLFSFSRLLLLRLLEIQQNTDGKKISLIHINEMFLEYELSMWVLIRNSFHFRWDSSFERYTETGSVLRFTRVSYTVWMSPFNNLPFFCFFAFVSWLVLSFCFDLFVISAYFAFADKKTNIEIYVFCK